MQKNCPMFTSCVFSHHLGPMSFPGLPATATFTRLATVKCTCPPQKTLFPRPVISLLLIKPTRPRKPFLLGPSGTRALSGLPHFLVQEQPGDKLAKIEAQDPNILGRMFRNRLHSLLRTQSEQGIRRASLLGAVLEVLGILETVL